MSESIQFKPSAGAGTQQSKVSTIESGNNSASAEKPSGFTAVFASYSESDPNSTDQQQSENHEEMLTAILPQDMLEAGNSLPEDQKALMWQALMTMQPSENGLSNTGLSSQAQGINFLNAKFNPGINQDYFQTMAMLAKEGGSSMGPGIATNNIAAQLAAAHFTPEKNDALLLNMNEQFMPAQGPTSTLSTSLAAVGLGTATQAAATQTQMAPLNLGQNAWETNLGSRLQMLVGQNVQTAEIRLDPPELGALDIKIKVTNDVATVNISSPHTQVREALETAVPRLREMFEESGLSLGDVNVRQESFAEQHEQSDESQPSGFIAEEMQGEEELNQVTRRIVSNNLLDTYA